MSGVYPADHIKALVEAIDKALNTVLDRQTEDHQLIVEIHAACTAKPDGPSPLMDAMASIVVLLNRITETQAEHSAKLANLQAQFRHWLG